jgi:hypothetical protein
MIGQVRWLRVVIAAFLVEVGLSVTAIPFVLLFGQPAYVTAVPALCVAVPFMVVWFATHKLASGRALHGLLIGIVATVMYFALVIGVSSIAEAVVSYGSVAMFVGVNALRVVSAAAGGYAAGRRAMPSAA